MPNPNPNAFEDRLIAQMRANGGRVTSGPLAGHPLLVMTSIGARSGQPRRAILTYSRDGADYIVAGSAGGSPKDPIWVTNLRANPDVTVETGNTTFGAKATIVDGRERDRLWAAHVSALPHFAEYPKTAGRPIPIVRLTPLTRPVPIA